MSKKFGNTAGRMLLGATVLVSSSGCDHPPEEQNAPTAANQRSASEATREVILAPPPWFREIRRCDGKLLDEKTSVNALLPLLRALRKYATTEKQILGFLGPPKNRTKGTVWRTPGGTPRRLYSLQYPSRGLLLTMLDNPVRLYGVKISTCDIAVDGYRLGDPIRPIIDATRDSSPMYWDSANGDVWWVTTDNDDYWWFRAPGHRGIVNIGVARDMDAPKVPRALSETATVGALAFKNAAIEFRLKPPYWPQGETAQDSQRRQ